MWMTCVTCQRTVLSNASGMCLACQRGFARTLCEDDFFYLEQNKDKQDEKAKD
jgi:hypothetical protein